MYWRALFSLVVMTGFLAGCLESPSDSGASTEEGRNDEKPVDYEAEIERTRKRVEGLEKRLEGLQKTYAKVSGQDEEESSGDEGSALTEADQEYMAKLRDSEAYFFGELEIWREATRKSFEGIKLPSITTSDGDVYYEIVITKVDGDTLEFEHKDGDASLKIESLEKTLRKNLIHEPTVLMFGNE